MLKEKLRVCRLHFWKRKQEFQEEPTPAQQPKVGEGFGPGDDFVGNSIRKNPASKPKPIENAGRWIKFYKTRRSVVYISANIFFTLLPKGKRSSPFRIFGKSCICPKQAGFGCWKKFQLFPKSEVGDSPEKVSHTLFFVSRKYVTQLAQMQALMLNQKGRVVWQPKLSCLNWLSRCHLLSTNWRQTPDGGMWV